MKEGQALDSGIRAAGLALLDEVDLSAVTWGSSQDWPHWTPSSSPCECHPVRNPMTRERSGLDEEGHRDKFTPSDNPVSRHKRCIEWKRESSVDDWQRSLWNTSRPENQRPAAGLYASHIFTFLRITLYQPAESSRSAPPQRWSKPTSGKKSFPQASFLTVTGLHRLLDGELMIVGTECFIVRWFPLESYFTKSSPISCPVVCILFSGVAQNLTVNSWDIWYQPPQYSKYP